MRRVTEVLSTGEGAAANTTASLPLARSTDQALLLVVSVAGALAAVLYVVSFWALDALPFQDVPNHLARAVVLADLLFHHAARFGAAFKLHLEPAPYLLNDVVLASLVDRYGPYAAGRLWVIVTWASLPVAVAVYLRARRYAPSSILLATIVAFYLATDWSFMTGFQAYRLGVALTLCGIAAWQRVLETGSIRSWLAYVACIVLGYLTHLSSVIMTGVAAGATGLMAYRAGKVPFSRLVLGAFPLVAAMGWELAATHGATGPGLAGWGPIYLKVKRTVSMFHRYEYRYEVLLCGAYVAINALLARDWKTIGRRSERAVTSLVLAATFLVLFFVMPQTRGYVSWIDCRALPFVPLFVLFAALAIREETHREMGGAAALAILLVVGNIGLLRAHLLPNNEHMREYREVSAHVPSGAFFLPIATRPQDNATNPFLHAGCFAIIESGAISPYLFVDGVTRYLRRRGWLRIVPTEFWYQQRQGGPFLGWEMTVAGWTYPYLLWEKPYDPSGGPFLRTELLRENDAAALMRIVP